MATNPNFATLARSGTATVSIANTAFDGSGEMQTILTGAATGTRIDAIHIAATGTTTTGLVNLFISNTTAPNTAENTDFLRSLSIPAVTPSATVSPSTQTITSAVLSEFLPLFLPSGFTLRASTTVAQSIKIVAQGADF